MLHWGILKKVEISIKPETERKDFVREQKKGFSLMELMVVLLIVAIIAAASAPMVSRKLARDAAQGDSPWVFTGTSNSIAYNMAGDNNSTAIIGTNRLPAAVNAANRPKLYIESNGNESQIGFGRRGVNNMLSLTMDTQNNRVGFSDVAVLPRNTVAFGTNQVLGQDAFASIAIGPNTEIGGDMNIAIGSMATVANNARISVAIGNSATATDSESVAVGTASEANGKSVAIGKDARAAYRAIAVGCFARAEQQRSVAIGDSVQTNAEHQIIIGFCDCGMKYC